MRLLTVYNNEEVFVEYVTDLINETQSNFTVMEVRGLDDAEKALGIDFKQIAYSLEIMRDFCAEHGFGLKSKEIGTPVDKSEVILVEPSGETEEPEPEEPKERKSANILYVNESPEADALIDSKFLKSVPTLDASKSYSILSDKIELFVTPMIANEAIESVNALAIENVSASDFNNVEFVVGVNSITEDSIVDTLASNEAESVLLTLQILDEDNPGSAISDILTLDSTTMNWTSMVSQEVLNSSFNDDRTIQLTIDKSYLAALGVSNLATEENNYLFQVAISYANTSTFAKSMEAKIQLGNRSSVELAAIETINLDVSDIQNITRLQEMSHKYSVTEATPSKFSLLKNQESSIRIIVDQTYVNFQLVDSNNVVLVTAEPEEIGSATVYTATGTFAEDIKVVLI